MTNQLTYTDHDTDTDTLAPAPPPSPALPAKPSLIDQQPEHPSGNGRRWMLLAGGAALAATAVLGIVVAADDRADNVEPVTDQLSASAIIQDEIDAALSRRDSAATVQQPAYLVVQNAIDAALAERNGAVDEPRPTAQLVQDEIDAALAAAAVAAADGDVQRSAYLIIQDEIDAALAERNGTDAD